MSSDGVGIDVVAGVDAVHGGFNRRRGRAGCNGQGRGRAQSQIAQGASAFVRYMATGGSGSNIALCESRSPARRLRNAPGRPPSRAAVHYSAGDVRTAP